MHILHPWYCERVEEEAKLGQFFRGNPSGELYYLRRMFRWRGRRSAPTEAFSDSAVPTEGSSGLYEGLTQGKIAES